MHPTILFIARLVRGEGALLLALRTAAAAVLSHMARTAPELAIPDLWPYRSFSHHASTLKRAIEVHTIRREVICGRGVVATPTCMLNRLLARFWRESHAVSANHDPVYPTRTRWCLPRRDLRSDSLDRVHTSAGSRSAVQRNACVL